MLSVLQVLIELQNLLPTFEPKVLNSMLVLKNAFDASPGADKVMEKLFQMPMQIMMKVFGIQVRTILNRSVLAPQF